MACGSPTSSSGANDSGPSPGQESGAPDVSASDSGLDVSTREAGDSATCAIGGKVYPSGTANPATACQTCSPARSGSGWTNVSDGTTCATGICYVGACVSGCEIGGTFYPATASNPSDPCQSCRPGVSTASWTNLMDGSNCGNGQVCSGGTCGSQCVIGGIAYPSGQIDPGNSCQACMPGTSTSSWTASPNGTSCGAEQVCDLGSCNSGCYIAGAYYPANAANPNDPVCESCQPAASTTAWTPVPGSEGMTCLTGQVCHAGQCGAGCLIDATYYAANAPNPSNPCQACAPASSTTTWTNVNALSCGTDMWCYGGTCGSTPPSCAAGGNGLSDCGASSESCCTSLTVAGGTYYRTYANNGDGGTAEADPASVSSFRLDKYLVTVGRFRQFVGAWEGGAGYLPPPGSGKHSYLNGGLGVADSTAPGTYETGWVSSYSDSVAPSDSNLTSCDGDTVITWTPSPGTQETLPINCVTWEEAYAFCIWDGGFLPTEAEWEFAAAGGSQQREYPWGTAAPGFANQYAIYGSYYTGTSLGIAPVGTAAQGSGLWGQLDLVGDVFEWNMDWFFAPYHDPCTDCAPLTEGGSYGRVTRGGTYDYDTSWLLPPTRIYDSDYWRYDNQGFRCARSP